MNVTISEVEFYLIRYGINQAIQVFNTEHIIIITDAIPAAKCIFNSSFHLFQLYFIVVS